MAKFVHQKSSLIGAIVSMTLFVLSFSNGMELKLINQDLRIANHDQSELHKNILDQIVLHRNLLDQSKFHHKRTLDQSELEKGSEDQAKDEQSLEAYLGKEARSKSEFRPKRAVFDILPEGSQRATGGRRISFERRDDQLLQFSKRKEEKDRMKGLLKKYLKTLLSDKKPKTKRYSSLRVCRFTFMKICQRLAQIGK